MKEEKLIKEFIFNKKEQALVHPYVKTKTKYDGTIDIYLITLGHLWIYKLILEHGYGPFLIDLLNYAKFKKTNLLEWDVVCEIETDVTEILLRHKISYVKYLATDIRISDYKEELENSKNKEHSFHRITRLLFLMKYNMGQVVGELRNDADIEQLLEEKGPVINAAYLGLEKISGMKGESIIEYPESLENIVMNNMQCSVEREDMKYYVNIKEFSTAFTTRIYSLGEYWYTFSDEEQVVLSKLLYSLKQVEELGFTLIGVNGILSTFVTRSIFDGYWQSKYLIQNGEVEKYREFTLDRMRLHILKRKDANDITNVDELSREIKGGLIDPIPIHGDFFTKSAREYSIELGIKDDYDKYYEYNSEFIHSSLTAIYAGLMKKCENPEHDGHLTIYNGAPPYIDSLTHIFEILNNHIDLVNDYFKFEIIPKLNKEKLIFTSRKEFLENWNTEFM